MGSSLMFLSGCLQHCVIGSSDAQNLVSYQHVRLPIYDWCLCTGVYLGSPKGHFRTGTLLFVGLQCWHKITNLVDPLYDQAFAAVHDPLYETCPTLWSNVWCSKWPSICNIVRFLLCPTLRNVFQYSYITPAIIQMFLDPMCWTSFYTKKCISIFIY